MIQKAFRDDAMSAVQIKVWHKCFKDGQESVESDPCSGRHSASLRTLNVTQPHYSSDLAHCNFWLFPKLKSPLKEKRFQITDEIQENTTGQLMAVGRTV